MKKRKTYEISLIDKTYSKTISDETKFYTSDTSLELVFKLKETEYTFESAEIVFLNINDKSLITRRVVKSDEGFVYTFEKDVIAHYGEWKAQLMFIENVDAHVASPIKFRIENDLYNTKPQALSDVVSWVNLKLYAEKLVGEFKQAVDEAFAKNVEIENTFKTNEQNRQTAFENAEHSRKTTFNASESERDETFNTNEDIRQTQELERVKSEGKRQTVFDDNEASRTETFNTNEATRQENETARQSSEQQRIEAETLRVERDSNRETEINNIKKDIVYYGGLILNNNAINGDFSKGKVNWLTSGYNSTFDIIDDVAKNSITSSDTNRSFIYTNMNIPKDNVLYYTFRYKQSGISDNVISVMNGYSSAQLLSNHYPDVSDFKNYSGIGKSTGQKILRILINTNPSGLSYSLYLDYLLVIDLTDIFGAGNEPSKTTMDWIIKENGYFDELTLRRDDLQQYEINQLRKAVIALGGTI